MLQLQSKKTGVVFGWDPGMYKTGAFNLIDGGGPPTTEAVKASIKAACTDKDGNYTPPTVVQPIEEVALPGNALYDPLEEAPAAAPQTVQLAPEDPVETSVTETAAAETPAETPAEPDPAAAVDLDDIDLDGLDGVDGS